MVLTADDIKALKEVFATKEDLKVLKQEVLQDVDKKLEAQTKILDQKLEQQTKDILAGVGDYIHDSLLSLLDNHDERIERLEKNSGLTPLPLRGQ